MTLPTRCPRCGSARLVNGALSETAGFVANAATASMLRSGVPVNTWMRACGECGLVVAELDTAALVDHLRRFASERTTEWLTDRPDRPL